jgi:hypothetical protein
MVVDDAEAVEIPPIDSAPPANAKAMLFDR